MKPIKLECPLCHGTMTGDASMAGQRVQCPSCEGTIVVPEVPVEPDPPTARLVSESAGVEPVVEQAQEEVEVFDVSPSARAHLGMLFLGLLFVAGAVGVVFWGGGLGWPAWAPLVLLGAGILAWVAVWLKVKSVSYRLTTQRLFVRQGLLAKHLNELELYRVKDVVVKQGGLERLLGYGTITVLSEDESTPELDLRGISRPAGMKETIRAHYRAARQREGVHPAEFMQT